MIFRATILLLAGVSTLAFAQAPAERPDLAKLEDGIIASAQRDEANTKNGREIVCTQHTNITELKDDGSVKEQHALVNVPVLLGGKVFMRTIERDGAPLTGKPLKNEKEREKHFLETAAHPREKKDDGDLQIDRELLSRFTISLVGEGVVSDRPAWVLTLLPKPGDHPERTHMERVANHIAGKLWVDKQDLSIVRGDLALTDPVSFYSFVGKLRSLHIIFEQKFIDGLWADGTSDVQIDARAMMSAMRQHVISQCADYVPRTQIH